MSQAARQAEQDLTTYFTDYPDALCPPSGHEAMVAAIGARGAESGLGRDSWQTVKPSGSQGMRAREEATELNGRLERAARDEYQVRRVLGAAGPRAEQLLRAGCVGEARGLEAFGARATLAPYSSAARWAHSASGTTRGFGEWLVRLSWRLRTEGGLVCAVDRILAQAIAAEAAELWREAMCTYLRAQEGWRARERGRRDAAARAARARGEAVGAWDVEEASEGAVECYSALRPRTGDVVGIGDEGQVNAGERRTA